MDCPVKKAPASTAPEGEDLVFTEGLSKAGIAGTKPSWFSMHTNFKSKKSAISREKISWKVDFNDIY